MIVAPNPRSSILSTERAGDAPTHHAHAATTETIIEVREHIVNFIGDTVRGKRLSHLFFPGGFVPFFHASLGRDPRQKEYGHGNLRVVARKCLVFAIRHGTPTGLVFGGVRRGRLSERPPPARSGVAYEFVQLDEITRAFETLRCHVEITAWNAETITGPCLAELTWFAGCPYKGRYRGFDDALSRSSLKWVRAAWPRRLRLVEGA
jgi:hypothetical protein